MSGRPSSRRADEQAGPVAAQDVAALAGGPPATDPALMRRPAGLRCPQSAGYRIRSREPPRPGRFLGPGGAGQLRRQAMMSTFRRFEVISGRAGPRVEIVACGHRRPVHPEITGFLPPDRRRCGLGALAPACGYRGLQRGMPAGPAAVLTGGLHTIKQSCVHLLPRPARPAPSGSRSTGPRWWRAWPHTLVVFPRRGVSPTATSGKNRAVSRSCKAHR